MTDINTFAVTGRLTRGAELKYTNGGMAILNFSIAVNRSRKIVSGQYVDDASYFDCKILGKYGEALSNKLSKGKSVTIKGYLYQERWEDSHGGGQRSRIVLMVEELKLGGEGKKQQDDGGQDYAGGYGYN